MTNILEYAAEMWTGESSPSMFYTKKWREDGIHQLSDSVWMWPAFGNVYIFPTDEGLVFFDAGEKRTAQDLHAAIREKFDSPLHTAIYSHGHIDHIFGTEPFDSEAREKGWVGPTVIAHENVIDRFERYKTTQGYNTVVNQRQFGSPDFEFPNEFRYPDVTYRDSMQLRVGGLEISLHHRRGETDDATIAWLPHEKILCCGDFFIWAAPNPGNPQKAQRYAADWAAALRWMASLGAELLLPGHGMPIKGEARVRTTLLDTAEYLEALHGKTIELINDGRTLDEVIHTVQVPEHLRHKSYLQPSYDEPEFIVRNVWRLFAGWYDGNPANLKPPQRADFSREIIGISGGIDPLITRARQLLEAGENKLAASLAQLAVDGQPDHRGAHEVRVEIFSQMKHEATSTMSKGVYRWAQTESEAILSGHSLEETMSRKRQHNKRWGL